MHCGFSFSFVKLKHFPFIIKGLLGSEVSYKFLFIFLFYFIDVSFHMRLLTEALITIEGSKVISADVSLKSVIL